MSKEECENAMKELTILLKNGVVKSQDIVRMAERDCALGKVTPEMLTYTVRYLTLIDKINSIKDNKLINLQEIIDSGLCGSREELQEIIEEHYDEIKDQIFYNYCTFPEPTDQEISQIYDSDDPNKVCITCCRRKRLTVFVPCGHSMLCTVCSKEYVQSNKDKDEIQCVICRKSVEKVQKIYL